MGRGLSRNTSKKSLSRFSLLRAISGQASGFGSPDSLLKNAEARSLLRVAPNKEIAALQSRSLFRLKFPSPNSAQPGYEPQDTGPNYVRNALRLYLRNRSDFPEYDCASAF